MSGDRIQSIVKSLSILWFPKWLYGTMYHKVCTLSQLFIWKTTQVVYLSWKNYRGKQRRGPRMDWVWGHRSHRSLFEKGPGRVHWSLKCSIPNSECISHFAQPTVPEVADRPTQRKALWLAFTVISSLVLGVGYPTGTIVMSMLPSHRASCVLSNKHTGLF